MQYAWFFSWWNYAFSHPVNLFITHKVWPPEGYNLTQATSLLGAWLLSLPFQVFTSPVIALNIVALLTTGLAGWTMYLFCYCLTGQRFPAVIGGLLFCFSGYMVAQLLGHLNLTGGVFFLPVLVYLVWLRLHDHIPPFLFVLSYAVSFVLFFLISSELAFTSLFAGGLAFFLAKGMFGQRLSNARSTLGWLVLAYLLAGVIVSPYLYYFFFYHSVGVIQGSSRGNDLLGLFIPTSLFMVSTQWTNFISSHFLMNLSEQNAYLGLPLTLAVCWFSVKHWQTIAGKFLVLLMMLFFLFSFGDAFFVGGYKLMNDPISRLWYKYVPFFHSVLLSRIALYAEFIVCIMMAIWLAQSRGKLRVIQSGVLIVALLFLMPSVNKEDFPRYSSYNIPRFFTSQHYKEYLQLDEHVLLIGKSQSEVLMYQAYTHFYFTLTLAYMGRPLEQYTKSIGDSRLYANASLPLEKKEIWAKFHEMMINQKTESVIVTMDVFPKWRTLFSRLGVEPFQVDDVMIYSLKQGSYDE